MPAFPKSWPTPKAMFTERKELGKRASKHFLIGAQKKSLKLPKPHRRSAKELRRKTIGKLLRLRKMLGQISARPTKMLINLFKRFSRG